jgi:hypothetical protein
MGGGPGLGKTGRHRRGPAGERRSGSREGAVESNRERDHVGEGRGGGGERRNAGLGFRCANYYFAPGLGAAHISFGHRFSFSSAGRWLGFPLISVGSLVYTLLYSTHASMYFLFPQRACEVLTCTRMEKTPESTRRSRCLSGQLSVCAKSSLGLSSFSLPLRRACARVMCRISLPYFAREFGHRPDADD